MREIRKGLEILGRAWPPEWGETGPRRRLGRVEAGVWVTRLFPQLVSAFPGSHRFLLSFFRRRQRRLKAKTREGAVVTSGGPKGGSRSGYLPGSDSQRPEDSLIRFYPIPLRPDSLGRDSDLPAVSLSSIRKSNFHFSCCSLGWFPSLISPAASTLAFLIAFFFPQGIFLAGLSALGLCGLVHLGPCD